MSALDEGDAANSIGTTCAGAVRVAPILVVVIASDFSGLLCEEYGCFGVCLDDSRISLERSAGWTSPRPWKQKARWGRRLQPGRGGSQAGEGGRRHDNNHMSLGFEHMISQFDLMNRNAAEGVNGALGL